MTSFDFSFILLIFLTFLSINYVIGAQNSLILPIRKDIKTSQFYTTIQMGSTRASINIVIDLGAPYLWFACNDYTSNTYSPIPCGSSKCDVAGGIGCSGCNLPPRPGCANDTCGSSPYNPFLNMLVSQGFGEDTLHTKDGAKISNFSFSCMDKNYLEGLAKGNIGMLGLARTRISLHKQVANKLRLPDRFSLCLPSSSSGLGKLSIPAAKPDIISLKSTPLILNPVSTYPIYVTGDPSDEYFIDVKSIRVAGKHLELKSSYFSIDSSGVGGTKISTIQNFTALHNSIYKPFTRAFVKAAADMKIKSAAAVPPFRTCFESGSISREASAPEIDLVLPGKDVYWRINGANSLVEIDRKTTCLGFVDGGSDPRTSIVIGTHQLEDNFLEFDLLSSKLRFSSSLLIQNKTCSRL